MRGRLSMKKFMSFVLLLVLIIGLIGCGKVVKNQCSLSITKEGEGTVEPAVGTYSYEKGTMVTLTATADTANGWYFSKWGGPDGTKVTDNKILMDDDRCVTAVFSQLEYSLDITVTPQDAGQVYKEILPSVQSIEHGKMVQLTADGNVGYVFDHWEGDLTGSDNPANLTMDKNKSITAVFTKLDHNLNISVNPQGSGTITTNINSSNGYEHGQTVTLTTNPANGYVFDHWEGDLRGTSNPSDVTIDSEKNIVAIFVKKKYSLTLSITPQNAGEVEAVTLPVLQSIEHGETVRLTAKANPGYLFDHWESDLAGNDNPISLTMDNNKAVTAVFIPWKFLNIPMRRVPGAASIPIGTNDSGTCTTVNYAYWMAETEVTYEQWSAVYSWAVTHGYKFANPGTMVDGSGDSANHPVTNINWRDAMIWCNALTEYYNVQEGTSLTCVYHNGEIVRDATNTTACDNVTADTNAKGFRLPTSMEWELAGRYRGSDSTNAIEHPAGSGVYWTKGNSASGATAAYNDANATGAVAWYNSNSGSSIHAVASKTPNFLGIYDMSGNVWEWCFDWYPGYEGSGRVRRGGGWSSNASHLQLGNVHFYNPSGALSNLGFRPVRTE